MTLRNYVTPQLVASIVDVKVDDITDKIIDAAEIMVDNAIAEFHSLPYCKAYRGQYSATGEVFENNSIIISGAHLTADSLIGLTIQIMSGEKAGQYATVTANTPDRIDFNTIDGLTGTVAFRVWQVGKAPFAKDSIGVYRVVCEEVQKAVAYQVEYLLATAKGANSVKKSRGKKSESIGTSYSYTLDDKANQNKKPIELLAPQAAQILSNSGLTYQSFA